MKNTTQPLIVIAGPTASGKTSLSIKLAEEFDGEIICADSRTIYKGMDIGTAKPSNDEQSRVRHWGLDLVEPNERFTVAEFKAYANEKIADIRRRGKVPFLVGGTGLYVDAIVYDYDFPERLADVSVRLQYESMTLEQLHEYCGKNNIDLPENYKNKRYVINAIVRDNVRPMRRDVPIENCIIVGITTDKDILHKRIDDRAEEIFTADVVQEASRLAYAYGWENEAMTGNIYPLIRQYLAGELSLEEAKDKFKTLDWRLAKRQLTWLRRHEHIRWLTLEDAYTYCARELAQSNKS